MKLTVQATISAVLLCGSLAARSGTPAVPPLAEVYDIVKAQLPGMTEAALNEAAVNGLLAKLGPRVSLIPAEESPAAPEALVTQTNIFENVVAYLRIGQVAEGVAAQAEQQLQALTANKSVKGVVLDLRYAGGTDYESAAKLVDLFVQKKRPILDWGNGMYQAQGKDGVRTPVAVLVNGKTSSAAEALAAAVRDTGAGLILGNTTAGTAWRFKDFALKNGQKLRVAQGTINLGSGAPLPETGIKPDITIVVREDEELAYFGDPYTILPSIQLAGGGSTNVVRRAEMNEAELVRSRRAGVDSEPPRRAPQLDARQLRDPALARAVDLLRGLALVWQSRS